MIVNAQSSALSQRLKQVFQTINQESCPRSFNFHMHTIHSDGKLQPAALIDQAITIGLKDLRSQITTRSADTKLLSAV